MLRFLIDLQDHFYLWWTQLVKRWLAMPPQESHLHGRKYIHHPTNIGDQLADRIAATMGSWRFIIAQTVVVLLWMTLNVAIISFHWDPYPFILLNLLFSTQAAYAAPIIMMSQNRQAAKDHLRDDHEAQEVDEVYQINELQLTILKQQNEILDILHQRSQPVISTIPPVIPDPPTPPFPNMSGTANANDTIPRALAPKRSHHKKVAAL